jgi:hypothetical protein
MHLTTLILKLGVITYNYITNLTKNRVVMWPCTTLSTYYNYIIVFSSNCSFLWQLDMKLGHFEIHTL